MECSEVPEPRAGTGTHRAAFRAFPAPRAGPGGVFARSRPRSTGRPDRASVVGETPPTADRSPCDSRRYRIPALHGRASKDALSIARPTRGHLERPASGSFDHAARAIGGSHPRPAAIRPGTTHLPGTRGSTGVAARSCAAPRRRAGSRRVSCGEASGRSRSRSPSPVRGPDDRSDPLRVLVGRRNERQFPAGVAGPEQLEGRPGLLEREGPRDRHHQLALRG